MNRKMYVGIGIGSSRVKIVSGCDDFRTPSVLLRDHLGTPREAVADMLKTVRLADVAGLAVTGGEGASLIAGRKICECEAIEEGLELLDLKADAILSLGGESFVAYPMDRRGRVLDCVSGNRCAAGTVEFFKQQLGRMGLTIEEGTRIADSGKVVPLARRCSVHCKSDCTHALNKNRCSVADVVHTLCHNMAEKAAGLLRRNRIEKGDVLVIGGAAANVMVVDYIRSFLPECRVIVPDHAPYFETLGAAALARSRSLPLPANWDDIFAKQSSSFDFLEPLGNFAHLVTLHPARNGVLRRGRKYLLGIDGGSTTTKAALVDDETLEICASIYVRTNGNPEQALKECLRAIRDQVGAAGCADSIEITGVATTGSSGEILSVLCETTAYHNEIVAHAFGAARFCPDADTIFEVGGQDSKFTSLRAGVPVDFNMNESCSAGTGSFIEESAREDLGVPMEQIAERAIQSKRPPRFSDQCAAFANSDIRKAFQEGATKEDNLAGLVYAIAENYISKVVGERKIGDRILFQGGTSKNRAIAYAFAAKTGKQVEVPPNSELIGCYGIALWLREKMACGEIPGKTCDLNRLLECAVSDRQEFSCKSCENLCTIQNLSINGRKYPFGGQCSKWENARNRKDVRTEDFDHVAERNRMMFEEFGVAPNRGQAGERPAIGMQGVFSVYSLYPLYSRFFAELGHAVALSEYADPRGTGMCQSNRCYPYEIAHGTFYDLLQRDIKTLFVPHVAGMPRDDENVPSLACPIAQAVPYYVSAAFADHGVEILDPVLDMSDGIRGAERTFIAVGASLGHGEKESIAAFRKACEMQEGFEKALKEEGRRVLEQLERENRIGIVIVGRPYNAFSKTANMGVPRKFASRGVTTIPFEYLPFEEESAEPTMYWKYGQMILKSLKYIKRHPMLFPAYISNFGCGPDSFLQHFAGFIMGNKPMLYLELDSHTADAGIGTRPAAFLDIISGYRRLGKEEPPPSGFRPAEFVPGKKAGWVRSSDGELVRMKDPRVTLVFPSMGGFQTEAGAAAAATLGMKAIALPPVDDRVRAIGKSFTSGKECSPAVFTVGSMIDYCRTHHGKDNPDNLALFFMPTASGPCRFGQYNVYIRKLVEMLELKNIAVFSPTAANGYGNLGWRFMRAGWLSFIIADLMRDIEAVLKIAAEDPEQALLVFRGEWKRLLDAIGRGYGATWTTLRGVAERLGGIRLKQRPNDVPKVLLTGEIYVRSDELSRRSIEAGYAEHGLMLKIADSSEWLYYCDWLYLHRLAGPEGFPHDFMSGRMFSRQLKRALFDRDPDSLAFVGTRLKLAYEQSVERKARRILAGSGLVTTRPHDIDHVVRAGSAFVPPALAGEAILTAGATSLSFKDSSDNYCGAIFIGPFNCMPTGVAESVMKPYAREQGIPYLTFETDGGPLTPNFRSQMEVHMLRCRAWAKEHQAEG